MPSSSRPSSTEDEKNPRQQTPPTTTDESVNVEGKNEKDAATKPDDQQVQEEPPKKCKHCGELVYGGHDGRVKHRNTCKARAEKVQETPEKPRSHSALAGGVPNLNFDSCKYCGKVFSKKNGQVNAKLQVHEEECKKRLPAAHRLRIEQREKEERKKAKQMRLDGGDHSDHSPVRPRTTSPGAISNVSSVKPLTKRKWKNKHDPLDAAAEDDDDTRSMYSVASTTTLSGLSWSVPGAQKCVTPNLAAYDKSMETLLSKVLPPLNKLKDAPTSKRNQWGRCKYCHKRVVNYLLKQHEQSSCIVGSIMGKVDRLGELIDADKRLTDLETEDLRRDLEARSAKTISPDRVKQLKEKHNMRRRPSMKKLKEEMNTTNGTTASSVGAQSAARSAVAASSVASHYSDDHQSGRTSPVEAGYGLRTGVLSPRQYAFLPERDALLEEAQHIVSVIDAVVPVRDLFMEHEVSLNQRALDPRGINYTMDGIDEVYGRIIRRVTEWMERFSKPPKKPSPKKDKKKQHDSTKSSPRSIDDEDLYGDDDYSDDFHEDDDEEEMDLHDFKSGGLSSRSPAHNPRNAPSLTQIFHNPKLHRRANEERKSKKALAHADYLSKTKTSEHMGWENPIKKRQLYGDLLSQTPMKSALKNSSKNTTMNTTGGSVQSAAADAANAHQEDDDQYASDFHSEGEDATSPPRNNDDGDDAEHDESKDILSSAGKRCKFDEETLRLARAVCDGRMTLNDAVEESTTTSDATKKKFGVGKHKKVRV